MIGYRDALYEAVGLAKAETVTRTLCSLGRAIGAELTSIESQERRADEDRRLLAGERHARFEAAGAGNGARYLLDCYWDSTLDGEATKAQALPVGEAAAPALHELRGARQPLLSARMLLCRMGWRSWPR
ncbi:hypothetical protein GCM10010176_104290 [Nonomuraea spiralis]|nr:hypothetical protein GCM10010176_104290 [Nonomuraea spiralis]